MAEMELKIERPLASDFPEVLRLLFDFEELVDSKLNLRKLSSGADTERSVLTDIEKEKFQCLLVKSENGNSLGISLWYTSVLSCVGPVLLLTIIYVQERQKGIGQLLLDKMIKNADKMVGGKIQQVHFMFNQENHWAWEFYKRFDARNYTVDNHFLVIQFDLTHNLDCSCNVVVRPAAETDRTQVAQMIKELHDSYHVPIWNAESINVSNPYLLDNVYVAEDCSEDGTLDIIGLVSFYYRYSIVIRQTPTIVGIFVKEGHRRRSVGSAMMNHLAKVWMSQEGCVSANTLVPAKESSSGHKFFVRLPGLINRTKEDTWNYCVFDRPAKF